MGHSVETENRKVPKNSERWSWDDIGRHRGGTVPEAAFSHRKRTISNSGYPCRLHGITRQSSCEDDDGAGWNRWRAGCSRKIPWRQMMMMMMMMKRLWDGETTLVGLVNAARVTEVDTITSSSLIKLDDRQRIRDESERSRSVWHHAWPPRHWSLVYYVRASLTRQPIARYQCIHRWWTMTLTVIHQHSITLHLHHVQHRSTVNDRLSSRLDAASRSAILTCPTVAKKLAS